jgi:hypothetical protein
MFIKYKNPRAKSGQSTVEYIVLVTAVIGTIILFMNGPNSVFQRRVNETLDTTTSGMDSKASLLDSSRRNATFNSTSQSNVDAANWRPFNTVTDRGGAAAGGGAAGGGTT